MKNTDKIEESIEIIGIVKKIEVLKKIQETSDISGVPTP